MKALPRCPERWLILALFTALAGCGFHLSKRLRARAENRIHLRPFVRRERQRVLALHQLVPIVSIHQRSRRAKVRASVDSGRQRRGIQISRQHGLPCAPDVVESGVDPLLDPKAPGPVTCRPCDQQQQHQVENPVAPLCSGRLR